MGVLIQFLVAFDKDLFSHDINVLHIIYEGPLLLGEVFVVYGAICDWS